MARLTVDQKMFNVESVIKTNSNVVTWRQLKKSFAFDVNTKTVWKNYRKWNLEGTVQDLHKVRSLHKIFAQGKIWPVANGTRS